MEEPSENLRATEIGDRVLDFRSDFVELESQFIFGHGLLFGEMQDLAIQIFDQIEDGSAVARGSRSFFGHEQRDVFGIDRIGFGAAKLGFSEFFGLKGIDDGDEKIG